MALSFIPQVVSNAVTTGQPGFVLPTASSSAVPPGQEGKQSGSGYAGATGGFGGPPTGPAKATTIQAPAGSGIATPSTAPKVGTLSPLTAQKNALRPTQQAGIPSASGTTLTAPKAPGADSRTDAERQLAREQTVSTLQPMTLAQKGQQAQLAQNSAASGLSPEVAAGMQQLALMQGAQDVRTKVADVTNSSYGNAVLRQDAAARLSAQRQADGIDALLTTNVGTAGWDAAIDAALRLDPSNAYYQALKNDPSLVKILGDANLRAVQEANREASSGVIARTITDPASETQLVGGFGGWRGAEYSGTEDLLRASGATYNFADSANDADVKEYERIYGTKLDPASEADRETAAAWSQYRDAVRLQTATAVQDELVSDLSNGGVEMTLANLEKIQGMSADLAGMIVGNAKLGDVSAIWDGDLTDGRFSTYFTGWNGEDLTESPASTDPYYRNLDLLWKEYVRQNPEGALVTREEFRALADQNGISPTEVMGTSDPAEYLSAMNLGNLTPAQVESADPTRLDLDQVRSIAMDDTKAQWWLDKANDWQTMPHLAYESFGGDSAKIDNFYSFEKNASGQLVPSRWSVEGTLFTGQDGRKYRVPAADGVYTRVGDKTIGVFIQATDLETGLPVEVQIGKHKKGG